MHPRLSQLRRWLRIERLIRQELNQPGGLKERVKGLYPAVVRTVLVGGSVTYQVRRTATRAPLPTRQVYSVRQPEKQVYWFAQDTTGRFYAIDPPTEVQLLALSDVILRCWKPLDEVERKQWVPVGWVKASIAVEEEDAIPA